MQQQSSENGLERFYSMSEHENEKVELEDQMIMCPSQQPKYKFLRQGDINLEDDDQQSDIRLQLNGAPIEFENNLFKGRISFKLKTEQNADSPIFKDKKRRSILVIQGQFKQPFSFDDIETGQEFKNDLNIPKSQIVIYIFKFLLSLLQKTNPSFKVGDPEHNFFLLTPLIAAANYVYVSTVDDTPKIDDFLIKQQENMLLVDDSNLHEYGHPLKPEKRKAYFCKQENRLKHKYDTNLVYTCAFYQHAIDFRTFQVPLNILGSSQQMLMGSFKNLNLYDYSNDQPLKIMGKHNKIKDYAWSFDLYPQKDH